MASATKSPNRKLWGSKKIVARYRSLGLGALLFMFTLLILIAYLSPFGYMAVTSIKTKLQITDEAVLPKSAVMYQHEGEQIPEWSVLTGTKYPLYRVTDDNNVIHEWALIATFEDRTIFLDPAKAREGVIEWTGEPETFAPATEPETFSYLGTAYKADGVVRGTPYPVYEVPIDGAVRRLALFKSEGDTHTFLDPAAPEAGIVEWQGDLSSATALEKGLTYTHRGKKIPEVVLQPGVSYPLYEVPAPDGGTRRWAMVQEGVPGQTETYFIDPENLDAGILAWSEQPFADQQRPTANPVRQFDPQWGNFRTAWIEAKFSRLVFNTLMIAIFGMIGTVISCTLVAYAFTRFPIPFKGALFMILLSTIILPKQVTLVPTYFVFSQVLGWTGTWLPLIVPHFFANAYNVLLLRQYFSTLPIELDEAAMIDGAGPFRILISVIIPQAWPAIVAVSLFHFVFAWNDYFEPLIYTLSKPEIAPLSVGIQIFNFVYDQQPHLIQATALMGLVIPVVLFFLAQRVFMRGVIMTGVDK
ncbi:MAG: carbohydrate ABC transporter permease [Chloroflexota bacterium]